jgi:hypothetical protein
VVGDLWTLSNEWFYNRAVVFILKRLCFTFLLSEY